MAPEPMVPSVGNGIATESPPIKPMNLRRRVDRAAVNSLSVPDRTNREAYPEIKREFVLDIQRHTAELAGPGASPIVESLALTVAMCEHDLRVRHMVNGPQINHADGQKYLDRAARRYLAAVKMLATVQRMGGLNIQVNLATNQVAKNT
jgi:hypothetical protein